MDEKLKRLAILCMAIGGVFQLPDSDSGHWRLLTASWKRLMQGEGKVVICLTCAGDEVAAFAIVYNNLTEKQYAIFVTSLREQGYNGQLPPYNTEENSFLWKGFRGAGGDQALTGCMYADVFVKAFAEAFLSPEV